MALTSSSGIGGAAGGVEQPAAFADTDAVPGAARRNAAVRDGSGGGSARPRPRTSNLIEELEAARIAERHSAASLARSAGVGPRAVRRLFAGAGPVSTLLSVFAALPFHVAGLARGRTFAEQLRNRRVRRGLSLEDVARKASVSVRDVAELEEGGGGVESLLRVLAVIAPRIGRRRPERVYWGLERKIERDSRFTPETFMRSIYAAFGGVDVDPCAHPDSPVVAVHRFFLQDGVDGMTTPWVGRLAFVNPPYSELLAWLERALGEWEAGNVDTVVCLVPARLDSPVFHDLIRPKADVFVMRGRLKFADQAGRASQTPFSLMVVAFGSTADQRDAFARLVRGFWIPASGGKAPASTGGVVCRPLIAAACRVVVREAFCDARAPAAGGTVRNAACGR